MRNISKRNVYALHKKVSLLGPKYVLWERDMDHGFQTYHGEEPTNKSFYKNVSLDYNRMSRKWSIKTKDKTKYTTSEIFTLGFNNTTHYFQDSESNLFYFFRDGVVKGPFKDILLCDEIDKINKREYTVVDTKTNRLYKVDNDTLELTDMQTTYINDHLLKHDNGKYAYMENNVNVTGFVFDSDKIKQVAWESRFEVYSENNTDLHIIKNGKECAYLKNYGVENLKVYSNYSDYFDHGNLLVVTTTNNATILDQTTREVLFSTTSPVDKILKNDTMVVFVQGDKSICACSKKTNEESKTFSTTVKTVPYQVVDIQNESMYAKDKNGKYGIISIQDDKNVKSTKFIYDDPTKVDSKNKTFLPIIKDGKMGLFNTKSQQIEVEPFCKNIYLNEFTTLDNYVGGDLYRFVFEDKNGKFGVVNNKNNIVVTPVLDRTDKKHGPISEFRYKDSNKIVYIEPASPNLFAKPGQVKMCVDRTGYSYSSKDKYDEADKLFGATMGGLALGPVGAVLAYGLMSEQKTTHASSYPTSDFISLDVSLPEEFKTHIHLDAANMESTEFVEDDIPLDTLTMKQYLEVVDKIEKANSLNKSKQKTTSTKNITKDNGKNM